MAISDNNGLICECGGVIKIVRDTNWDTLVTCFYPVCESCGATTRNVFDSREQVVEYLKLMGK